MFLKLFLISCLLGFGQALIRDGLAKVFGSSVGTVTNVRTTQLLNQLCYESQAEDTLERDACYGCFFRSSQQPSGYPMLLSMGECAARYLNDTDYGHCSAYLRSATASVDTRASSTTIYCTFLECIRQVNKDNLEALMASSQVVKPGHWSSEAKFVRRKTSMAFVMRRFIFALRGICVVRDFDGNSNTIRPGVEAIDPRRSNDIDTFVRGRGDRNIFQFYINGRFPRPAFREYDRMYSRKDTLLPYESDNGGLSARGRYYD